MLALNGMYAYFRLLDDDPSLIVGDNVAVPVEGAVRRVVRHDGLAARAVGDRVVLRLPRLNGGRRSGRDVGTQVKAQPIP